jgi:Uma2 family endonuclease
MVALYDWLRMPEDDLLRHEIIDGVHYAQRAPTTRHQRVASSLLTHLGRYARTMSDSVFTFVGVVLSEHDVVIPDIVYVSNARRSILREAYVEGPPDIVVEVVTDESREFDNDVKRRAYARCGVAEYWLVDPDTRSVRIGRGAVSTDARGELTSPLLPDFSLPIETVFAD